MNELDEAEVRLEFRRVYKDVGYTGALRVVYELLTSANILMNVIIEERNNEKNV